MVGPLRTLNLEVEIAVPSFGPDLEAVVRQKVEQEVRIIGGAWELDSVVPGPWYRKPDGTLWYTHCAVRLWRLDSMGKRVRPIE